MNDIDAFILAGGASSRMQRDKARLLLGGKTFVERAASTLSAVVAAPERLFVVGNLEENWSDLPILPDEFSGESGDKRKRGAIVGLRAALKNTKANWAAILACDLPFASGELFERLASLRDEKFDAVVPVQPDGKRQPLCALYRRAACLPVVEAIIGGDDWSLRNLLRLVETRFARFDEIGDLPGADLFFFNVNTPEDYANAQAVLAKTL